MKLLLKLLLSLMLLLLIVLSVGYAFLRSHWGITTVSRWISDATPYHLSVQRFTHDWSHPLRFELNTVTFGEDGQPALLITDKLTLTLNAHQFISPLHFSRITIEQGTLVLSNLTPEVTLPVSADHLVLQAVKLLNPYPTHCLSAKKIDGILSPWQPSQQALLGKKFTFAFSAQRVNIAHQQFDKLVATGNKDHERLIINTLSGAVERGTFSGQLSRSADGQWQVPSLQLDNIRFQTTKRLNELLRPFTLAAIDLHNLSINHLSIVGPDWVINDLSATGQHLVNPPSPSGHLVVDAQSVVIGTEEWSNPHLTLTAQNDALSIDKFNVGWARGTVTARGLWQKSSGNLSLDELSLSDIRYTLPENWRAFLHTELPPAISSITVKSFNFNNGLLIDVTPQFPFQMTAAHITGNQLLLAEQHRWGLWAGTAEYYAAAATFNRQDVRALWFTLEANNETLVLRDIKALVDEGPMVGNLTVSQQPPHTFALTLRGDKFPYAALTARLWPQPLSGRGSFTLQLKGALPSLLEAPAYLDGTITTPTFTQRVAP